NATLIGNGPDILKKIEAVGNNLDFAPGFCGKNGQSVPNEVGQPTIKVSKITVGGTKK
ncbi:MAG: metallopeptidase TldD-related protein, partial [Actinomycetota bacterium]|nr:metallopeptidase TldD-related protein [Actinomycetota bacterium]